MEGETLYDCRSEVRVVCREMAFPRYPLDRHICLIRLSSCEYQLSPSVSWHRTTISDGYDNNLMKISGRFSYDRSSQRDIPFYTEIRELDLSRRVFVGDESKASYLYTDRINITF